MPDRESVESAERVTPIPFEDLHGLVKAYDQAADPGHAAAFLRSASERGRDISTFGEPASTKEIADLKHDDARALAELSERLGLSLEVTKDLTDVIGYAHIGREQYAWAREQFPDKPERWPEEYEIWAWEPERRQSLANGVTVLARLTGETYLLGAQSSRFKVTPETTADEVMEWYGIPTPEQSLEIEGHVDPRAFSHHYHGFRQTERALTEQQFSLDHRVHQLTEAFRDSGTIDWYNHEIGELLRVSVVEGGAVLAPFRQTEANDWRARWVITLPGSKGATVFQDAATGRLGVESDDGLSHEFPEDQETVAAAVEACLTAVLAPGARVHGYPVDVYQRYTVLDPDRQ